ncbi:MAG: orotidine-5'-phosphate decarboxylase [Bacteroidales bacterium]|nr:orotidine-5'-phosphate decarboxylase [Bacteroidales bacterium]MDE6515972.1 orotidine-5'-phosphate decarboxylase [Bacteroidales bacterium]MDE7091329.1 orotidine-5'-phosphate decarboxylase [Bacteroidales bacterium]MDE7103747.1 orotidine-5'-phosphate decarboxylase [Bacteroidales bacterium]
MNRTELIAEIRRKKSFLCVGLDPDMNKIPACLQQEEDVIFAFNKAIIDATLDYAVAYKPNLAFYEAYGLKGMMSLKKTIDYLRRFNVFTIADAKRGDIGNTSLKYAQAYLDPAGDFNFNAITVAPYMGEDSVKPFLQVPDKFVVLLALTSNPGARDFQNLEITGGAEGAPLEKHLYEQVLRTSTAWGDADNMMYVVGATRAEFLSDVRRIVPNHFLLVPGVGAQGGSLEEVCRYGLNDDIGLLINASRSILYAGKDTDFAEAARAEAARMQQQMQAYVR